jgi:hypothetical protein
MDPSAFNSVDEFLKAARAAKKTDKQQIADKLGPLLDDAATVAVPPDLLSSIEALVERYGDEALRSTAIFCLGRWAEVHQEWLEQHILMDNIESALWTMNDTAKLSLLIQNLAELGSFGGDDDWRAMLKRTVGQAVLENLEERGMSPDDLEG